LIKVSIEFLREQHRQRRINTLPDLTFVHNQRDTVMDADADKRIWTEYMLRSIWLGKDEVSITHRHAKPEAKRAGLACSPQHVPARNAEAFLKCLEH
jgi:hypothetical protein